MSSFSKQTVIKNVEDEYKFQHTRTTTTTYTNANNKNYTVQNKEISSATQKTSFTSKPLSVSGHNNQTLPSSSGNNEPASKQNSYNRTTTTYKTKSTYKAPKNQSYTFENRQFSSSIQKSSHSNYQGLKSSRSTPYYSPSSQSCIQKSPQYLHESDDESDSYNSYQSTDNSCQSDDNYFSSESSYDIAERNYTCECGYSSCGEDDSYDDYSD